MYQNNETPVNILDIRTWWGVPAAKHISVSGEITDSSATEKKHCLTVSRILPGSDLYVFVCGDFELWGFPPFRCAYVRVCTSTHTPKPRCRAIRAGCLMAHLSLCSSPGSPTEPRAHHFLSRMTGQQTPAIPHCLCPFPTDRYPPFAWCWNLNSSAYTHEANTYPASHHLPRPLACVFDDKIIFSSN